jgi:glycosyltransferase involved in cell wall biosynthesis
VQIHQFHGVVAYGDAIGNHILNLQRMLRKLGHTSEIFTGSAQRNFEGRAWPFTKYHKFSSPDNVLLCHFSIGYSTQVMSWLQSIPDRKVIIYHNITPHQYFAGISETFYENARAGREQLRQLCMLTQAGWGDSDFNRRELVQIGWQQTAVLPIVFEPAMHQLKPSRAVLKRYQPTTGPNMLFVGRLAPNKKFEDLILTLYHLKHIEPQARLFLVGTADQMETYQDYLQALIKRLNLDNVILTGHISRKELVAYYQVADVYLSMSEHEGFGMPLLESMYFDVPVVAFNAAAVPETMGGAGILVTRKDHAVIAELVSLLARDTTLRTRVLERQRRRWQEFTPEALMPQLQHCLETIP